MLEHLEFQRPILPGGEDLVGGVASPHGAVPKPREEERVRVAGGQAGEQAGGVGDAAHVREVAVVHEPDRRFRNGARGVAGHESLQGVVPLEEVGLRGDGGACESGALGRRAGEVDERGEPAHGRGGDEVRA